MASISGATDLPPGFRFHPTDEEIITHYLSPKVVNPRFCATAVGEIDLNKCEPWDLPGNAKMGEKEWYFCKRDKKYPTGMRTNRATESGYWKATGKDKDIFMGEGVLVGMKKTLVFYMGRAPKGEKSNWVMHEFRLEGKQLPYIRTCKDEWVVCMIFQKRVASVVKSPDMPELSSCIDPTLINSFTRPELSYDQDVFRLDYGLSSRHNQVGIFNPPQTSGFFPQNQTSSAYFQFPVPASAAYMHQNLPVVRAVATTNDTISPTAIKVHRKAEQFSSHSTVSCETRHSPDRNTEITLEAMKHYRDSSHSFDDLGNPDEPFIDLDSIWK